MLSVANQSSTNLNNNTNFKIRRAMVDMNSITNEIQGLEQYVVAMKKSYTDGRLIEHLDNLLLHINTLKAWAGLPSDTDSNCNIQHVGESVCRKCGNTIYI